MLGLRRVGEATLLRDSDKIPQLINLHRHSDTPLGPPVCLRLADRLGAERAIQRQNRGQFQSSIVWAKLPSGGELVCNQITPVISP